MILCFSFSFIPQTDLDMITIQELRPTETYIVKLSGLSSRNKSPTETFYTSLLPPHLFGAIKAGICLTNLCISITLEQ